LPRDGTAPATTRLRCYPPYTQAIIDEAHTIEDAATSFFSKEFSRSGILRHVGRLYRKRRAKQAGLLLRLCAMLPSSDTSLKNLVDKLEDIRKAAVALDGPALDACGHDGVYRFSSKTNPGTESAIFPHFMELKKKLMDFTARVRNLLGLLPEDTDDDTSVWEVKAILRRFDGIASICAAFVDYRKKESEVMWLERRKVSGANRADGGWAAFTQSPVELAESLRESLFKPYKTIVCVSATLTVNGSFGFWASTCRTSGRIPPLRIARFTRAVSLRIGVPNRVQSHPALIPRGAVAQLPRG